MNRTRKQPLRYAALALTLAACFNTRAAEYASPVYQFAQRIETTSRSGDSDRTRHNQVLMLEDGLDALLLRVHLIRNAQSTIDIQTSILANDECGRLLMCELFEAARRGVVVRLMLDHFMSARDARWIAALTQAHPNLELRYYRPPVARAAPCRKRKNNQRRASRRASSVVSAPAR